jgi:hypothetical protein
VNAWVRLFAGFVAVILGAVLLKVLPPLLVLALLIGGVAYVNVRLKPPKRSIDPAGTEARILGLEHAAADPFGVVGFPLLVFSRGSEPRASEVLWGTWRGIDVKAFELSFLLAPQDGMEVERRFSCGMGPLPTAVPSIVVEPVAFLTPFPEDAPAAVPLEADGFDAIFVVRCNDPAFAREVLHPDLRRWLVGDDGRWGFELGGGLVVAYRPVDRRTDAIDALEAMREFLDRVPPEVRSRRPA